MDREAWTNGWPRAGRHIHIGTVLRCAGCGADAGVVTVALDENWTAPGREPSWPFRLDDCPVCQRPAEPMDRLTARALLIGRARMARE